MKPKQWAPAILIAAALVPILYVVMPLIHLISTTSTTQVVSILRDGEFLRALSVTLLSATISTCLSILCGLPAAFFLSRGKFFGKSLLEALLLFPLVLPPIVGGIGLLAWLGPYSTIGGFFSGHGLTLSNSVLGVVLAQLYITSPFVIISAKSGFDEIPSEYYEAVQIAGGGIWDLFWHISLPLSLRSVAAGAALTFARAFGEFGATMMMAYHPYTVPVDIWVQFSSGGLGSITPIAAFIVVVGLIIMLIGGIIRWIYRRKRRRSTARKSTKHSI